MKEWSDCRSLFFCGVSVGLVSFAEATDTGGVSVGVSVVSFAEATDTGGVSVSVGLVSFAEATDTGGVSVSLGLDFASLQNKLRFN